MPTLFLHRMSAAYLTLIGAMPPIPCRDDIARVAERNFSQTGVAVEVGVFRGEFSQKNLKVWTKHYYQIDAWSFRQGDPGDKNFKSDKINAENQKAALDAVTEFKDRVTQIKARSKEAASSFLDHSIDWLYIDALHTRNAVYQDLTIWWSKVRPGGLVSGDDYGDESDTSLMTASRWMQTFGAVAKSRSNRWGVISALDKFTQEKGAVLHVTWLHDCYRFPAWYFVKPF